MHRWLAAALLCASVQAASIRGTVVEHQSGRPVARALVVLQPAAGMAGGAQSAWTNGNGIFELPPLPAGAYLVAVSRRGFVPVQHGQTSWKRPGTPVVVEEAGATTLNIRLMRFGSIGGTVLDENDVGLPEHDVIAYRNTRPPQIVQRARTDDRGVFRIGGLEPGSYLVRTAGRQFEDAAYLPTFAREAALVEEARPVDVALDQQSEVIVRPFPGRLLQLGGRAYASNLGQVTLTLVSDTGVEHATSDNQGNFQFQPQPPGRYEILAAAMDRRGGANAAYVQLTLDRDRPDVRFNLMPLSELQVTVEDTKGNPMNPASVPLLARRNDLAGEGQAEMLRIPQGRTILSPGRWQLSLGPMSNYYAAGFAVTGGGQTERVRADGWHEVLVAGSSVAVKFVLAANPGTVRGTVTWGGKLPAGAPVFLELYDQGQRRRLGDIRTVRTDARGGFAFIGLAPGMYRMLCTYDDDAPDSAVFDAARAGMVKVEEGRATTADVELFEIR